MAWPAREPAGDAMTTRPSLRAPLFVLASALAGWSGGCVYLGDFSAHQCETDQQCAALASSGPLVCRDALCVAAKTSDGGVDYRSPVMIVKEPDHPIAIRVDSNGVYWIAAGAGGATGSVKRASLDGTIVQTLASGLRNPTSLSNCSLDLFYLVDP